jgi:hypothetical protein
MHRLIRVPFLSVCATAILVALAQAPASAERGRPFILDGVTFESQAAFIQSGGRCGTVARGRPTRAPATDQIRKWIAENRVAAGGEIPVAFHVISGSRGEGDVPEAWLDAQILVLNRTYAGRDYDGRVVRGAANTGYTFVKASVSRTLNNQWFKMSPGSHAEFVAKTALNVTPQTTLNLYTCKPGHFLLGWSTFPWELADNPAMDGVVIHYASLTGGPLAPYNLGGTAVHEVGHWIGLLHTFQDGCGDESPAGCETTGDLVCDTPGEATATFGCPIGADTCPGDGEDPIHNYMDYTDDACYDNFTDGQDARADFMMANYRPAIGSARLADAGSIRNGRSLENAMGKQLVEFRARPNPFNPRTKIEFGTVREGRASVRVFDIQGRLVATVVDRKLAAGNHQYDFDASKLSSGVYLMVLKAEGRPQEVRRLSLLK